MLLEMRGINIRVPVLIVTIAVAAIVITIVIIMIAVIMIVVAPVIRGLNLTASTGGVVNLGY